ncbi:ParA family protein [Hahella sp. CR1]|uniref:ParA family protein n=1 Tax=unclassified Hahella TaxID=2624107 RepID=UPI0024427139|nr:ParA family protein [Hahella sp. CR1]MDG9668352.1 ParA family protein [Hahella sp. CR1]
MRIWTVANQKGGVGKTTTAVALGGILAQQGKRVLLLDLDPHGSLTSYFKYDPDSIRGSVYDLFMHEGKVPADLPRTLIRDTSHPNLKLLPASTAQATLERKMVGVEGMGLIISKALAHLWDDFDYAFLDNTPVLGVLLINALAACQHILIPVQTEFLALKGLERMLHTLGMVMKSQKNPLSYTVIPTMFDRRTQASVQTFRTLRHQYGDVVWRYAIPVDTKFRDASRAGVIPSMYDAATHGVRGYEKLLHDLLEANVGFNPPTQAQAGGAA